MDKYSSQRFWELDFLRGIAIVSMVVFHACDDFTFIKGGKLLPYNIYNYWQMSTAILFLVIFGIAATLSNSRNSSQLKRTGFKRWLSRGGVLLGWGMIITFTTAIFLREGFVVFGILHLLGVCSVLLYPLLSYKYRNLFLGISIIYIGNYLDSFRFGFGWLLWLGLIPRGFNSVDYFPILPWFGYILIGIFLGNLLYPNGIPKFKIKDDIDNPIVKSFCFLGQKSLWIYILHQPLLLAIIKILFD